MPAAIFRGSSLPDFFIGSLFTVSDISASTLFSVLSSFIFDIENDLSSRSSLTTVYQFSVRFLCFQLLSPFQAFKMNETPGQPDGFTLSNSPSTTTSLPRRKRRRPALSCNECRRRKVKCDQKVPCTPCARSKTAVCIYDPDATPNARLFSSVSTNHNTSKILPKHTRNDMTLDRRRTSQTIAPAVMGSLLSNINSQGSSPSCPGSSTTQHNSPGQSVQQLNDRIRQLETMVTSMINTNHEKAQGPVQDAIDPQLSNNEVTSRLKGGTHQKSRFFTSSHWMNSKKEVSFSGICLDLSLMRSKV